MHILVCLKQVLDQEIVPSEFRVNPQTRRADVPDAALVMSIFDANALETALQLRDAAGAGSSVTALSLGPVSAEEVLRKAAASKADRIVRLGDDAFADLDPPGVATAIAAAVRRLDAEGTPVDLVLTGRQAGDWEHGATGGMVAEALGWPCLTFVSQLRPAGGGLEARREVEDGHVMLHARTPVVATITNHESNRLRLAKVRDVMLANRAEVPVWSANDLGLQPQELVPRTKVVDLVVPSRESRCELVEGESPKERAIALAARLRELKIV